MGRARTAGTTGPVCLQPLEKRLLMAIVDVGENKTNTGPGDASDFDFEGIPSYSVSEDGRYATFQTQSTNLVNGVNTSKQVVERDLFGKTTALVSVSTT